MYSLEQLQQKNIKQLKEIGWQINVMPDADRRCRQNWIDAIVGVNPPLLQLLEFSPAEVEPVEKPFIEAVETSLSVEVDRVQEAPLESKFGRIVYLRPAQGAIVLAAETSPGVKVERTIDYLDCPSCGAVHGLYATEEYSRWEARCIHCDYVKRSVHHPFEYTRPFELPLDRLNFLPIVPAVETSPDVDFDRAHLAIEPAVETSPGVDFDPVHPAIEHAAKNSILTGVTLSDMFLARYSPPQSENIRFQLEADGQLSLLDFEVQSEPEPPDPDDFESLDAFREAIAIWDIENPELAASRDSMCEWAPCPEEWYWPKAEILPLKASSTIDLSLPSEQFEVMELSITGESFITCNFFIPTFDPGVRSVQQKRRTTRHRDLCKIAQTKTPQFSPDGCQPSTGQVHTKRIPNAYQIHLKRIPNAYSLHCRWQ